MMKRGFLIAALLLFALALGSCVKRGDVSVKGLEDVKMHGFSRADLNLTVENRSGSNIRLQRAKVSLYDGDTRVLDVVLAGEVLVPRKSVGTVALPLRMKIADPMAALAVIRGLQDLSGRFTVSGEVVARAGWGRKKIAFERVPLEEILRNFGAEKDALLKSIGL